MKTVWQYKTVQFSVENLNKEGQDGWEYVDTQGSLALLKRLTQPTVSEDTPPWQPETTNQPER